MQLEYNSTTTLRRIREGSPESGRACNEGYSKLLKSLGKTKADDEPVTILQVLDSNGLDDALWVLSYAMPDDRLARHFQGWCAEQVLHIFEADRPDDTRVRDQISMMLNDDATSDERDAAGTAARDAVWAAARDAAWAAAWAAARDAAWAAARDAAGAAARAAAGAAAGAAAWDAAWAAAWDAAGAAAGAAARDAAWDAAWAAAWDAAGAAARDAAGAAARDAAWAAQEKRLREMLAQGVE